MGSDLYMEERSFRPRPNKAEWDGDTLIIYRDEFYWGFKEIWRGKVNEHNKSLIKSMVKIPPKTQT